MVKIPESEIKQVFKFVDIVDRATLRNIEGLLNGRAAKRLIRANVQEMAKASHARLTDYVIMDAAKTITYAEGAFPKMKDIAFIDEDNREIGTVRQEASSEEFTALMHAIAMNQTPDTERETVKADTAAPRAQSSSRAPTAPYEKDREDSLIKSRIKLEESRQKVKMGQEFSESTRTEAERSKEVQQKAVEKDYEVKKSEEARSQRKKSQAEQGPVERVLDIEDNQPPTQ